MGEIKSAFEKAMERTQGVSADKELLEAENYKKEGKKLVSAYLNDIDGTLEGVLKDKTGKQLGWIKEGMFQALSSNFILPIESYQIKQNMRVAKGFYTIINDSKALNSLFKQMDSFFNEYSEQRKMVRTNLEKQFAPRLRQKQEEISRQLGGTVHLDPGTDPEFIKYLKQAMGQLEERYSEILLQVKDQLKKMFEAG